jgi:hypothetical protein
MGMTQWHCRSDAKTFSSVLTDNRLNLEVSYVLKCSGTSINYLRLLLRLGDLDLDLDCDLE